MAVESLVRRCVEVCESVFKRSQKPRKRAVRMPRVPVEDLEIRCFLSATAGLATIIQPDGKTLVIGSSTDLANGNSEFAIARLNVDGTPDTTFSEDGQVLIPFNLLGSDGGEDVANCVALQPDGKIIVGGYAQSSFNGDYDFAVARLNYDGSLDTTFGGDGKAIVDFHLGASSDDRATGVAVASDGKIVLGGTAQRSFSGDTDFALARLTSHGELDAAFSGDGLKTIAFNLGGARQDAASSIAVQPNGAIVVAGSAERNRSGNYDFAIARVTAKGDMDKSFAGTGKRTIAFDLGGARDDGATSVALQGTNIVLGGFAQTDIDGNFDFAAVRLKSNGNLDKSFSKDGRQTVAFDLGGPGDDEVFAIAPQADGRLLLAGIVQLTDTGNYDYGVVRLTPNGSLDPAFGTAGQLLLPIDLTGDGADAAYAVANDPLSDEFVVAGTARTDDQGGSSAAVVRLTWNGTLDALFATSGLATIHFDDPEPPV